MGDISAYKMKNKGQEESISGNGVYSSNSVFDKAQYSSNYHLDSNDNSSRFASTEWVLQNIVPTGTIVMFSGLASNIPSGWHICDGTNGTPNLIGKFIKASNTSGETGG
nr:MAG TPA: short tail fiber protein [Bacteriophage sp.]